MISVQAAGKTNDFFLTMMLIDPDFPVKTGIRRRQSGDHCPARGRNSRLYRLETSPVSDAPATGAAREKDVQSDIRDFAKTQWRQLPESGWRERSTEDLSNVEAASRPAETGVTDL
jgi:hypothetical protein